jgi:DNA (cytosine-5)-methyltransferase 1
MTITVGSLFSGIGGIELGLERTGGFRTIWFCENDPYASAVLKKNWKDVPNLGDITKVDWDAVERPEMLTGGFPCQDISVAGKGKGIEGGHRSSLWFEYAKAIGSLQPGIALIENVPAILGRGLDIVLADLAEMRYDAEWFNLSASDVGAWHRRDRIFIIAYATSERCDNRSDNREGGQVLPTEKREIEKNSEERDRRECGAGTICTHISDTDNLAPTRQRKYGREVVSITKSERLGMGSPSLPNTTRILLQGFAAQQREGQFRGSGWWAVEPDVGRVADGIPFRVDRIKCLGNAVVPQVAQVIGEMILECYGGLRP